MEIWKDIIDYEEYKISNLGNIKRNDRLLKPFKNTSGYYQIELYKNGKGKHLLIHKLVANAFIENKNDYKYVNHKDENKHNNKADNLEWCSHLYNINYGTGNIRRSVTETRTKRGDYCVC